jgi:DNA-binding SARP family transcriptional activator/class 3 adenylate cyclase/tetratricopeptide (TPR) repeat protein
MLEFLILGPLEVRTDGRLVPVQGFRQRALLAMLLVHANEVVASGRLLDELWGAGPGTDTAVLRVRISQLRKALRVAGGGDLLQTRPPGYVLQVDRDRLDLGRHERLAAEAVAVLEDDPAGAAARLREALALWRGPPLADFAYEPFAQTTIGRLEELRLATVEKRVDAELASGREREMVGELGVLIAEHPLRERFRAQVMLALYRAGRQAEALEVYQQTRSLLVEELGIDPAPALQELHHAILSHDPSLERRPQAPARISPVSATPAPPVVARRESRKTVTVLACDVGPASLGGRLDAEVMRGVLERGRRTSSEIIGRHGGTVEGFVGDVVMAVFGFPAAHEDDALRALRTAMAVRRALTMLSGELGGQWKVRLSPRFGVDTGEVMAGDAAPGPPSVSGEAVHEASRLLQAAGPGEIVLGEATWRLTRDAVRAEFANVVTATGSGRTAAAWRLLEVRAGASAISRRFDTPFVGRAGELAQLRSAYERVCSEQAPCLFTVFGEAGIGKSRLAAEARLGLLTEAQVLAGRCQPYGEGVTFAALREIVHQALGGEPAHALRLLLAGEPDGTRAAAAVAGLLGLTSAGTTLEQGFWGVRRLCEELARLRPLVLVFEDVHWAETTMLDLIEYIAENACEAPILLLCLARHELLDQRPQWGGGKLNAASVTLEPLTGPESQTLVDWLIADLGAAETTRARVVETARGNPLFTEQLVAMLADGRWDTGEPPLPGTIEALLAARLDLLGPAERVTLEYAAALGDRFPAAPLAQLAPPELRTMLPRHLGALVRKELLRPAHLVGGGDSYRFRHILVREAAYRRLPKNVRADLRERYADWLESASDPGMSGGRAELLGYHLERAHAYRLQLGPGDPRGSLLAKRAAAHLTTAGVEAFARTDFRAVDQLLARATALMASNDPRRPALLYDRGTSLFTLGRVADADAVLAQALEAARATGDTRTQWRVRVDRVFTQTEADPAALSVSDQARLAREALRALEPLGDDRGLARAWLVAASVEERRGRAAKKEQAAERTLRHARRSGIYRDEAWGLWWLADAILTGPTPVAAGIARCGQLLQGRGELRVGDVGVLGTLALFEAMQGHFERGRQLIAQGRELMESLGHTQPLVATMCWRGELELLAGNPAAAEAVLAQAHQHAAASGSLETGAHIAALLARALPCQGRDAEAQRLAGEARAGAPPDSRPAQARWRSLLAAVHAARGQTGDAVALATHAGRLLRPTDLLPLRADVLIDLASALAVRGDTAKATRATRRALDFYTEKGNIVAAQRARSTCTALSARTVHLAGST